MSAGAWWYRLIPAGWPSWLVELASGLVTVALAALLVALFGSAHPHALFVLAVFLVALGLSLIYELALDPNGWSLSDVLQREVGIVAGCALLYFGRAWL